MAKVLLGSPLQTFANDKKELEIRGSAVGEVLGELVRSYPELKKKLVTANGTLSYAVLNYLDGRNIRGADNEKTVTRKAPL